MNIHKKLEHDKIVKLHQSGEDGKLIKSNGKIYEKLTYIIMDYIPEGSLYDVVENFQGVGEIVSHYFIKQVVAGLEYLQK